MPFSPTIKNLLFDLGGVILDLDLQATRKIFYELGLPAVLMQYPENMQTDLFQRYEIGKITTKEFRDEIRQKSGLNLKDTDIDRAWTAMLVGIPEERTRKLEELRKHYRLYMLSNTCAMHVPVFEAMYKQKAGKSMHEVFDKIYYSHEIGAHKPDHESWEFVLKDAGIRAEETLFLDDNVHNVKAALELGFQAIRIHEKMGMMDLGFDL